MRILGIDPGSRGTGFGIIEMNGNRYTHIHSGCIQVSGGDLAQRLHLIFQELSEIVTRFQPQQVAVEKVFVNRNVDSALKLGQARGAAICAVASQSIPMSEYSPREIKRAIVGNGNAAKDQVQYMVKLLLNLSEIPQSDAADALAAALCHSHTQATLNRIPKVQPLRQGRLA